MLLRSRVQALAIYLRCMPTIPVLLIAALTLPPSPGDTGAVLYAKWCSSCHGADARGVSKGMTHLAVPAADLASCPNSSSETEEQWVGIVRSGGDAYGLSMDMPAFGEAASEDQLVSIIRYVRSLCTNKAWPPGELNFPRVFLSEKAFPENELVLVNHDREQEIIYEKRFGPRVQIEAEARSVFDGGSVFDGVTAAFKYNVWHSAKPLAIATLGTEVTPPVGRQTDWEFEPYVAFGGSPGGALSIQGQVVATIENQFVGTTFKLGGGYQVGRFVPELEAGWTVPRGAPQELALYPQLWMQLSRLGHVAASVGLEVPTAGPGTRVPRLIAYLLWDFGDAPLRVGW